MNSALRPHRVAQDRENDQNSGFPDVSESAEMLRGPVRSTPNEPVFATVLVLILHEGKRIGALPESARTFYQVFLAPIRAASRYFERLC